VTKRKTPAAPRQRVQRKGPPSASERPDGPLASAAAFGSDVIAEALRATGVPWIALNPGASFRGLHDSIVNFLGNSAPQLMLCLHEEHAVAIAHGYAKVTGKPLAVALHANVGLMHASMAIFNAWCDRMPVLMLGATGPLDATKRRPWIDWIHTARDQGALVRSYVKWDDQPASAVAARESLLRAMWHACAAPQGPVYVNLDAEIQEARLEDAPPPITPARYLPQVSSLPADAQVLELMAMLRGAARPLLLIGRGSRDVAAWDARVALAEGLDAHVATDLKVGAVFPTDHPLHVDAPSILMSVGLATAIRAADLIVSLDWVDLAGALQSACGGEPTARVVHVSLDHVVHNGWSMDHQGHAPIDLRIAADPDAMVAALESALGPRRKSRAAGRRPEAFVPRPSAKGGLTTDDLGIALQAAVGARPISLTHLPLSWNGACWPFRHPLDYLGSDGGGGIGAGPGIGVGAALALRGGDRLPISICGDGDFLMGATALWTAVHYRIPLLVLVANNQSFYNDEVHQERMAKARGRPVANKWIGQRMTDPDIDCAALAAAQGARGFGLIEDAAALARAIREAIAVVDAGGVAVVDVRVEPGYTPAMAAVAGSASKRA